MDLKRLIAHFSYRIEAKAGGGFIAHATDPSVPPLEAPTRAELQQKIQHIIFTGLATEFPVFKLPLEMQTRELAFHLERKPDGGFAIHSADPHATVIEASTQEAIESHFLEKFLGFAGKHLMPELSQALAAQASSGTLKVVVNRNSVMNLGGFQNPTIPGQSELKDASTPKNVGTLNRNLQNSPIMPEPSNLCNIFRLILAVLIAGAMVYFFLRYR